MNFQANFPEAGNGMQNLGNTRFANATLQSLLHNPNIRSCLLSHQKVCRCTFCISCVLKTLIQQVKHNKVPISPIELHSNMNRVLPQWQMNNQEDAHEFLVGILKGMEETDISTQLRNLTHTGIESTARCFDCNFTRTKVSYQSHLQVGTQGRNIEEGIKALETEEILRGTDMVYCDRCNQNTQTSLKQNISHLPPREQVITKLQRITTLIEQCTDKETLQVVNGQLNTTIGLVKCHSKQYKPVLPQINNCEPSNKTIKPQRPFFSTRKRRKTATIRVAKPTTLEKELTESRLRSDNLIYTVKKSAYDILLLLCKKDRAEKLINGTQHKLKLAELNKTVDKIPEDIIENDLSVVQIYLEVDAWLALQQLVNSKRSEWKCSLCNLCTTRCNMIECDKCEEWFHWTCVNISKEPSTEWTCFTCNNIKLMKET